MAPTSFTPSATPIPTRKRHSYTVTGSTWRLLLFAPEFEENFQIITFSPAGNQNLPAWAVIIACSFAIADITQSQPLGPEKFLTFWTFLGGLYAQIYAIKNPDRLLSLCFVRTDRLPVARNGKGDDVRYNRKHCTSFLEWMKMGPDNIVYGLGSSVFIALSPLPVITMPTIQLLSWCETSHEQCFSPGKQSNEKGNRSPLSARLEHSPFPITVTFVTMIFWC